MGDLFSSEPARKAPKEPDIDEVLLELKHQRDDLLKYENKLSKQIELETKHAKEHLHNKKKEHAILCLKKKKFQEGVLTKTIGTRFNIETMINTIEQQVIQLGVLQTIQIGKDALQSLNEQMSDYALIMEETQDAMEQQKEISDMLSQRLTLEDFEDVEREYELLAVGNEEIEDAALGLPDTPTHKITPSTKKATETRTPVMG